MTTNTPEPAMKALKLRELIVLAKSGTHWDRHSQLSANLVNNAEAIAELVEAAENLAENFNQFSHGRSKQEDDLLAALAKIKE